MTFAATAALRAASRATAELPEPDVEPYRAHLFSVAYRLLADAEEAEDMVQDAFLRWHRASSAERAAVTSPEGWLVTVVSRLTIDRLRRARTERRARACVHPSVPGSMTTTILVAGRDATDHAAELASELSAALGLLLERLGVEERAALLLRDVFDAGYDEIARRLGRTEVAVRQVIHRARVRLRSGHARFTVPPEARARLVERFRAALASDDHDAMLALFAAASAKDPGLAPDARPTASPHIVRGPLELVSNRCGPFARAGAGRVASDA